MINLCVYASGSGSNFIELHRYSQKLDSSFCLKLLISNKLNCGAVEYAKNNKIKYKIIKIGSYSNYQIYVDSMLSCLNINNINLIALAGFLRKVPEEIIEKYNQKILNIHPSLLPKYGGRGFYGMNVHRAVIDSGEKKTGITIHFVDKEYDKGPIIYQEEVSVLNGDNPEELSSRVLKVEHRAYKMVIESLIKNNFKFQNRIIKED